MSKRFEYVECIKIEEKRKGGTQEICDGWK